MIIARNRITRLASLLMCIYSFTIMSLQEMIPTLLRQTIVVALPALLIMTCIALNFFEKPGFFIEIIPLCLICMELIMLFWNNHTIYAEGIKGIYGQFVPLLFFFACCRDREWFPIVIKAMMVFGLFYAAGTYVCTYVPFFYTGTVEPLMKRLYPYINYAEGYKAGITAHYSTNGMYLTNGFIALSCVAWSKRIKGKKIVLEIVLSLFVAIAFLICGKRGMLISLVLGSYIAYFLLTNKKKYRILKMLIATFIILFAIRAIAFVIPQVTNSYTHTIEMVEKGDVTTGRFELWQMGWEALLQAPLFGHGWRWFLLYSDTGRDVHNIYLQLLIEVGIIGSIPFFIFFVLTYLRTLKLVFFWKDHELDKTMSDMQFNPILFLLMYQSFFLIFIFQGTGFFNPEVLFPYMACSTLTHFLYMKHKDQLVKMNVLKRGIKACIG